MPILATFIGALLSSLASFFVRFVAVKTSIALAAVAALSALSLGLVLTFNALVSPLVQQAFSTQYGQLLGLAFPPVAGTCIAAIAAAWAACGLYKWQVTAVKTIARAG
jgi:hypothetical protein